MENRASFQTRTDRRGFAAATRLPGTAVMELKYVARQLLRRPGHTLAVIASLVIGLVASVGTFSIITSLFYGDMPGIAGRRSLARVSLRYDSPTGSESGEGGRRIVTAPRQRRRAIANVSCLPYPPSLQARSRRVDLARRRHARTRDVAVVDVLHVIQLANAHCRCPRSTT